MTVDSNIDADGAREVAAKLAELCAWVPRVTVRDVPEPIMRRAATVMCDDIAARIALCSRNAAFARPTVSLDLKR